jgi:HEPN domain-containing protein
MNPPKERIYKKEYAYELMRIAGSDLAAGQAIFDARAGRSENVAYFAEQVAEKCIKAVLCYRSIAFPAIHDLRQLLTYLPEIQAPPHSKELQELTIFGTVRRYEEGPWMLTWEESEIALDAAKNVFKWAQDIVKPV